MCIHTDIKVAHVKQKLVSDDRETMLWWLLFFTARMVFLPECRNEAIRLYRTKDPTCTYFGAVVTHSAHAM